MCKGVPIQQMAWSPLLLLPGHEGHLGLDREDSKFHCCPPSTIPMPLVLQSSICIASVVRLYFTGNILILKLIFTGKKLICFCCDSHFTSCSAVYSVQKKLLEQTIVWYNYNGSAMHHVVCFFLSYKESKQKWTPLLCMAYIYHRDSVLKFSTH